MRHNEREVLYGLAIGDALGAANEFVSPPESIRTYPSDTPTRYASGSPFGFEPGEITDDTQMTLIGLRAVQDSIVKGYLSPTPRYMRHARLLFSDYADWADSSPPDIGNQTRSGLSAYGDSTKYIASFPEACGNGGLMRASAPYLAGLGGNLLYVATALDTAITHAHPKAVMLSVAFAMLLERSRLGLSLGDAVFETAEFLAEDSRRKRKLGSIPKLVIGAIKAAQISAEHLPPQDYQVAQRQAAEALREVGIELMSAAKPPSGYAVNTLQNAIHYTLNAEKGNEYMSAVMWAVRAGGDSDTIASVTGAIAAAFYPESMKKVPSELFYKLKAGHTLLEASGDPWVIRAKRLEPVFSELLAPELAKRREA